MTVCMKVLGNSLVADLTLVSAEFVISGGNMRIS